jgi:cytosine/adenosine deaminase-related metal-dependent hydrolase
MKTRINGDWVVAWLDGKHQVISKGAVVFEDEEIVFVGLQADPNCPVADKVIYASGKIVSPGLINLHCIANLDLQLLKMDSGDGEAFPKPKHFVMNEMEPSIWTDQDFVNSAEFSVATLLKSGSTSFASVTSSATKRWSEAGPEPYALAEASEKMGARAWLAAFFQEGCSYTDTDGSVGIIWDSKKGQSALDKSLDLIKYLKLKDNDILTGFLFPARTDRCSDDLLKETMRQSKQLGGLHVRSHFSEYLTEYTEFKSRNPKRTMIEWLDEVGFLGPNVCLTHCIYIAGHSDTGEEAKNDLSILADSETSVCHCPVVIARAGAVFESFSRYLAAGINMGIGTDTFPPDLIEEIRLAALLNKALKRSRNVGTVEEVYNAITIGGAKALGREDLGRLAVGCKADISVFDLSDLALGAIDDPMRTLIHVATGRDCDTVIVNGKIVVERGLVKGIDESELKGRAQTSWLKYKTGMASWDSRGRDIDSMFPPSISNFKM